MARSFVAARLADIRPIRWLGELAAKMARVFGQAQDDELQILKDGVSMRVPTHAPDDILGRLAYNFQIPVFATELPARLRARMIQSFPTWEEAGLPQAIIRSLTAWASGGGPEYNADNIQVINWSDWPTPDDWFSKFWVVFGDKPPWEALVWGGFEWGEYTWGSTATEAEIREVIGQIIFWKSPQSLPVAVISYFDSDGFIWGVDEWGASSWGGATVVWPIANLWGEGWVKWGSFNWGNGKWKSGEMSYVFPK